MDFFEHQARARRKTALLVAYFLAAVVLIILTVYAAFVAVLFSSGHDPSSQSGGWWLPDAFAAVSLGTLSVISGGSLYKFAELSGGGETVARALGGRPVPPNTTDLRERVLLNVVEEMAIASGTPVPPVFVLDHEDAINAFAAGTTPQSAVITVTRGTIENLKRDELQGVVAYEFSHILNGDMRLNLRLIGLLNGILLIAMIGYFLMRSTSGETRSSDDDNKKGANALPLLGLCLYVIGYIGVFFGHLIKSAVSRQREFLADASAVQFTRYPDGIAGALKKIGGLVQGSRLTAERAEEASHMFFGNGLAAPLFDLLATHPPLVERIRRIDPRFDGRFPVVTAVEVSPQDVHEPTTLARQRAALGAMGQMGAAMGTAAFAPTAAVAEIGAPRAEHIEHAASVIGALPSTLSDQLRDPLGAVASIYALLLADDDSVSRQQQLQYLSASADPAVEQETLRVAPLVAQMPPEGRLPLVSRALPALKGLSPRQRAAFRNDVVALIEADKQVSLFEFAVQRLVLKRLLPRLENHPPTNVKYTRLEPMAQGCAMVLSTLAHCGARSPHEATRAFTLGTGALASENVPLESLTRDACSQKGLDAALDQLAAASPLLKKKILEACTACIGADGVVTVEEGELLRVIADALDCPMPPLLNLRSA